MSRISTFKMSKIMPKSRKNPKKKIKNRTCWKMTSVEKEIVLKRLRKENKLETDRIWKDLSGKYVM